MGARAEYSLEGRDNSSNLHLSRKGRRKFKQAANFYKFSAGIPGAA